MPSTEINDAPGGHHEVRPALAGDDVADRRGVAAREGSGGWTHPLPAIIVMYGVKWQELPGGSSMVEFMQRLCV